MAEFLPSHDPNWKRRYNSPPDDLLSDFYVPALERSTIYERAVGFFSSHLLAAVSPSLDKFVINGGQMKLITSPANLTDDDLYAMGKGEEIKSQLRRDLTIALSTSIPPQIQLNRLRLLVWMVAAGRLEIRIALREHPTHYSLFHEKIGVFSDVDGNWMTFTGSPNETIGAAKQYSESFPLHRSWAGEEQRAYAEEERNRVREIWSGLIDGIKTWTVNEWIEEPMRKHFGMREPSESDDIPRRRFTGVKPIEDVPLLPGIPSELELRDYQRCAVNDWLAAGGRGIFAMATGTGKTITALAAATQMALHVARSSNPLLIVVSVPSIDLVEQWRQAASMFGFHPAICHGNLTQREREELGAAFSAVRTSHGRRAEMVVTTAASLCPVGPIDRADHYLQRQLQRHKGQLLFIGDEMHCLGTSRRLESLPTQPTYTLGLSATPKRHADDEGTAALMNYFGDPVISISIKDAIYKLKALVEYDYFPISVDLTSDETVEYRAISARIAAAYAKGDEDAAEVAIRERTRLTQHAVNKQTKLRELMDEGLRYETHQIIYVAEGTGKDRDIRQLEETELLLRQEFGMKVERYYGETTPEQRELLQKKLADGEIQALLAMKCLDEGVDIPSVRIGIITASTRNPRQFVQRRGRLLRRDPNQPKSHSLIYDFIVLPLIASGEVTDSEKTLIGGELSRSAELASAARNKEVLFDLIDLAWQYGLDPTVYTWMELSDQDEMEEWI